MRHLSNIIRRCYMTNENLVREIKQGNNTTENLEKLYLNNRKFIYQIANKYKGYVDIEDLIQEAYFGLYEAVQRYEESRGVLFLTYATHWIKQFMHRYIENNSNCIRVPAHLQGKIREYQKTFKAYQTELNRNPLDSEICYILAISQEQLTKVKKAIYRKNITSLDIPLTEDGESTLSNVIPSDENIENYVIDDIYNKQFKEDLWGLVNDTLPEDEIKVIELRYKDNKSLDGIGQTLGITRDKVRQTEAKALRKLRTGAKARAFKNKYEEQLCYSWKGSVGLFKRTWMSSTEMSALKIYDEEVRHIKLKIDRGESYDLSVQDTLIAFRKGWL